MGGDYAFMFLIDLIGIAFIVIGSTIVNGLDNVSLNFLSKEESLKNAEHAVKVAANISLYVGIAILVINFLAWIWMLSSFQIPIIWKEIIKILFGAGIITTSLIIAAVYYKNAYNDIQNSRFYKLARSEVKKALNETLAYIKMLMQFYYGIAMVTAVIFIAMVIYDVSKNKEELELEEPESEGQYLEDDYYNAY